MISWPWWNIW